MYDAYKSCTFAMMWCAKTSNVQIANTECANERLPKRRKGQSEDVWIGPPRNDGPPNGTRTPPDDVDLRIMWSARSSR
jgi:hypothetical protein